MFEPVRDIYTVLCLTFHVLYIFGTSPLSCYFCNKLVKHVTYDIYMLPRYA
jgi:hypothetical protein